MKRLVGVTLATAILLALSAAPALATHTHVMEIGGDGRCVQLAAGGGEKEVVLPLAVFDQNPNVDAVPTAGRMHPLHVLVHLGVAGDQHQLAVAGTAAAAALCPRGIVND